MNGTSSVKVEFQNETNANTMNAKLATTRRFSRCMFLPINGDKNSGISSGNANVGIGAHFTHGIGTLAASYVAVGDLNAENGQQLVTDVDDAPDIVPTS